jgi:hypothetical protein
LENFDVDDGVAIARSPQLDMGGGQVLLEYARWYSNHAGDAPYSDIFEVKISNDNGASWTTVETVGPVEHSSGGWFSHRLWINDYVEPNDQMRLRFDASDYGDDSNIEAGIDAVKVILFSCGPPVEITTTEIPDWTQEHPFSRQLEVIGGYGTISWADQYNGLAGTGLTVSPNGLISGIPHATGLISFTAVATDALAQWDEQEYAFTINPEINITTQSLPNGTLGEYYAYQLNAIGGTGTLAWTDYEGDLAGTGLEFSINGLLFGTPSDTGAMGFIAYITDSIGAEAQKSFELFTNVAYICGDANSDGTTNVGDAVYLIAYVFTGGDAPNPIEAGDPNCDGQANVGDAVYLINYVFMEGPAPCCP